MLEHDPDLQPRTPLAPRPHSPLAATLLTVVTVLLTLAAAGAGYLALMFGEVTGSQGLDFALGASVYAVAGLAFLFRKAWLRIALLSAAIAIGLTIFALALRGGLH